MKEGHQTEERAVATRRGEWRGQRRKEYCCSGPERLLLERIACSTLALLTSTENRDLVATAEEHGESHTKRADDVLLGGMLRRIGITVVDVMNDAGVFFRHRRSVRV